MQQLHKNYGKKIGSIIVTFILISLIIFVLLPPATSVYLSPGTLSDDEITLGNTITFENVSLTIRGIEKIPITRLNFSIFNNETDILAGVVVFSVDGTEIDEHPDGSFVITPKTAIQSDWYGYGYGYGYDQPDGPGFYFGYGYGYGYGNQSLSAITIRYDITFTTQETGEFYANFSADSSSTVDTHKFRSSQTPVFTVYGEFFNSSLAYGWNLINIPVSTSMNASHLADNISNCEMISWFDAQNQTYKTYVNGSPAYDFSIQDGYGLFVYINLTGGTYVNVTGATINDADINITLYNVSGGWNMIGWYNSSSTNSSRLAENISDCTKVSYYNTSTGNFTNYFVDMSVISAFEITRGLGIFVQVSNQTYWHGEG